MEYPQGMAIALKELCRGCNTDTASDCAHDDCLVSFSRKCLNSYNQGNGPRIENGLESMPVHDMKMYDREDAAQVIAICCKWCHNCNDDHSENCVVSLCRRAMEFGITGDEVTYKGNSLMYLKDLEMLNPEFSSIVYEKYRLLT